MLTTRSHHPEMLLPVVLVGMEQPHHDLALGISTADMPRLIEIAGTARQRPIRRGILATPGHG